MDDNSQVSQGTPPPPPGYSAGDIVPAQNSPSTPPPPPPGYGQADVVGQDSQATPPASNVPNSLHINPEDSNHGFSLQTMEGNVANAGKAINAIGAGAGQGVLSTAGGLVKLADKLPESVANLLFSSSHTERQAAIDWIKNKQNELGSQNSENPVLNAVGYGGETLAEFISGDEAFKALSESDKLIAAAKVMKTLEKSPRLTTALKIGANALKTGARTGIVQGTQSLVRSGGDVQTAAEDAAIGGVTGGALGGATDTIANVLGKAGQTAEGVNALTEAAGNSATKEEVGKSIGDKIDSAKQQLHADYESGINQLQSRLQGQEINAQANPLQAKAQELLAEPVPGEHPTVAQAKTVAGDKLNPKVKELLTSIAKGEQPITDENIAEAERASTPSGLVDASGRAVTPEEVEPHGDPSPPYNVKNLVDLRQSIRSAADGYEYGDINSRVLRSLINDTPNAAGGFAPSPLDTTIEQMAQRSGNASAIEDYKNLRSGYRDKINLFDNPVISKLREGKVDDAARDFVGVVRAGDALPTAGKRVVNLNNLRTIIGDDGVKQFGKQVFGTIMRDSVKEGRFNPATFMDTMNKVTEETKNNLFDLKSASNGLQQLLGDAQSAAALQHLTRAGVFAPVGAMVGGHIGAGIGTVLGLVADRSGIAVGRNLLDYVANHPATWGAYKLLGKAANSKTAATAATVARAGASEGATSLRQALNGTKSSLGDNKANPNPNQGTDNLPKQPKEALNQYPNPEDRPGDESLQFNKSWTKPDWKMTQLSPQDESKFQDWVKRNPKLVEGELGPKADYDVRAHWLAAKNGDPEANLTPNKWDGKLHGSDKFKTPYNGGFSNESIYATPDAPRWVGDKLMTKDGKLVTDETPRK